MVKTKTTSITDVAEDFRCMRNGQGVDGVQCLLHPQCDILGTGRTIAGRENALSIHRHERDVTPARESRDLFNAERFAYCKGTNVQAAQYIELLTSG